MRIRILGIVATLLAGAGFASADPGACGSCGFLAKCKQWCCPKSAESYDAPSCCPACAAPCEVATQPIPGPKLFRAEVEQPTYIEGKKLPPVELIRAIPPEVELVRGKSPPVEIVRGVPPPVELVRGMPPPVELFRRQPKPPEEAPPFKIPAVKLFRNQQPPAPCCPPPNCPTCAGAH